MLSGEVLPEFPRTALQQALSDAITGYSISKLSLPADYRHDFSDVRAASVIAERRLISSWCWTVGEK